MDKLPDAAVQAEFEHAVGQLAFWQAMLARIAQDQKNLRFLLPAGAALALVTGALAHDLRLSGGIFAIAAASWTMGLYFTRVRRQEYLYNVAEAQRALDSARARAGGQNGLENREALR